MFEIGIEIEIPGLKIVQAETVASKTNCESVDPAEVILATISQGDSITAQE